MIPLLTEAVKDTDPEVRRTAVNCLGEYVIRLGQRANGRQIIGPLFDVLLDPDPKVRARATAAAGYLANALPRVPPDVVPREEFFRRIRKNLEDPIAEVPHR